MLIWVLGLPLALSPPVTEVHFIFIFSQSGCILCVSAVPVLPKGYSLVLLFLVCLDSFVSWCNSSAADNTERLTSMTKLCCSWLSIRGEVNQTFCWLGQEAGLSWNKLVLFKFRKLRFTAIKVSGSDVKIKQRDYFFCKFIPGNLQH